MRIRNALVVCAATSICTSMALAETTILDAYFIAGQVQPVIGIKLRTGQWQNARFAMALGMERIPGAANKGLSGFQVVVDASTLADAVPAPCAKRVTIPWSELEKSFLPERSHLPPTEIVDRKEWQKYAWEKAGCQVTLLIDLAYYSPSPQGSATFMKDYPGLQVRTDIMLRQARLTLAGAGKAVQIQLLALHKDIPDLDRPGFGRKRNSENPDAYDPKAFVGSNFNKNIAGVIGRKPSAEELAALRSTGGLDDAARANMDHHNALIIAIKASKTPLTHEQIQNILGRTVLAEGGPTRRSSAPRAQPAFAQFKPQWYGTWKSQDGKTTMTISASKMDVSQVGKDDKGKPTRFTSDYRWVNTPSPSTEAINNMGRGNEFGYSKKRTSLNEIAKRFEKHYEADLKEYKKDPTNFNFYDPTASRQAIAAITPGVYEVMWSQKDGEECVYNEYIVDGDRMLEVQDSACNWVQLFNRVVSSQQPMTAPDAAAGAPASAPQTPVPVLESAKCSKSSITDVLLAPWYKSTCDLIVFLRDPAGFQITKADASTDELFSWLRTGKNEDVIQLLERSIRLGIAVDKFYHGKPWDKDASSYYLNGIKKAGSTTISVLDPVLKVLNLFSDAYFFASNLVSGVKTISGAFETYNAVAAYLTIGNERNMLIDYINTRCGAPSGEEPCSVNQAGTLLMAQALIKTGDWEETANQIICVKVKKWFSCKTVVASDQEKQALLNWLETEYQAYRLFRSPLIRQQIGKAIAKVATGR